MPATPHAARAGHVDAHTHLLPPRLARRVRDVFDRHLPGAVVYPLAPQAVLDDLVAGDVTTAWSLPYAHAPGVADWLNPGLRDHLEQLATPAAAAGVELIAGCTLHPQDRAPLALLDRAVDAGARVLKLHCSVGGFSLDDPGLAPVWARCVERRVPVVVHAGRHVAGIHDGPGLEEVDRLARAHPQLRLIVAHAALPEVEATLALLARHPAVHADLTPVLAALPDLDASTLTRFADRLLFGSDAPNTGVPIPTQLEHWTSQVASGTVRDAVLGGTARRLIADVDG